MGLPQTDGAEEQDVPLVLQEAQPEQLLNLRPVDPFGPDPTELVKGFEDREAGLFEAPGNPVAVEAVPFALHEVLKELVRGPFLASGLGGQGLVIFDAPRQAQIGKQFGEFHAAPPS